MGAMVGESFPQRLSALEQGLRHGLLARVEGGAKVPLASLAILLSLPALATRSAGAVLYLVIRMALMLLAPGLFQREFLLILIPFGVVAMSTVFRTILGGHGPLIFALFLTVAIVPSTSGVRRQVVSVRQGYRSNGDLHALAKAARVLPPGTCIATLDPALVYLGSGHSTCAAGGAGREIATHIIVPRRDPLPEDCIATRSLMLCPR
jgi:hypothetical protein